MAINPYNRKPLKVLAALAAVTIGLYGLLFAAATWGDGPVRSPSSASTSPAAPRSSWQPRLVGNAKVSSDQLDQARDIIVQRVDANGVAGAEVTTSGGRNIVVSMPGTPRRRPPRTPSAAPRRCSSGRSSRRRPAPTSRSRPAPRPAPRPARRRAGDRYRRRDIADQPASADRHRRDHDQASSAVPRRVRQRPTTTPPPTRAACADATTAPRPATPRRGEHRPRPRTPATSPRSPLRSPQEFQALDCAKPASLDGIVDDPAKPLVTCSDDGAEKYILGPVEVRGDQIKDAVAGYQPLSQRPAVQHRRDPPVLQRQRHQGVRQRHQAAGQPRRTRATGSPSTLDSQVLTAPTAQAAILDGQASITGSFTIDEARDLANQLKFGALPLSFDLQTRDADQPDPRRRAAAAWASSPASSASLLVFVYSLAAVPRPRPGHRRLASSSPRC